MAGVTLESVVVGLAGEAPWDGAPSAEDPSPEKPRGESADVTIIGGGPTGLYGLFYAGMRGMRARLIDALPELGGQLRALYPEKYIYDVAGFPKVLAKDLCDDLARQALQFDPELRLDERVEELRRLPEGFEIETATGIYPTRSVVIAAGKGAFQPRPLEAPGYERLLGKGVWSYVRDPEVYRGKRVLIVGGGDSAFDWSWELSAVAERLVHIHRSDRFRAHERTVELVRGAAEVGKVELLTPWEVRELRGEERLEGATIVRARCGDRLELELDAVLALIGYTPDLGPIEGWGLALEGKAIRVDSRMMTSVPGVFAAGDVATYDGKLELLSTGFGEVAIAVNHAARFADPEARVNPGHSTNLGVFREPVVTGAAS
jgi:ferredoxin/flavodoxin---NADP+ reductase